MKYIPGLGGRDHNVQTDGSVKHGATALDGTIQQCSSHSGKVHIAVHRPTLKSDSTQLYHVCVYHVFYEVHTVTIMHEK